MARKKNRKSNGLTANGFFWRLVAALVLVIATYNPSSYSAYYWISLAIENGAFGPEHLLAIALLSVGWVIYGFATWRSLGVIGVGLAGLVLSAIVWLMFDLGLLQSNSPSAVTWISLISVAVVLAVGVSWSHIWRKLTGQLYVDDGDD